MLTIEAVDTMFDVPVTVVPIVMIFVTAAIDVPVAVVAAGVAVTVVAIVVALPPIAGVNVVTIVVAPPVPPPETGGSNGSRWYNPERGLYERGEVPTPAAKPSCVPFTYTE